MTTTATTTDFDAEKRVSQYVQVRDLLRAMDDAHEKRRKQYVEILETLSGLLQSFMDANSIQNLKTKGGTCYVSVKHTASLADPDAFMKFVVENKQFDLLDRRANATAVRAFVEEHKTLPPGCNTNTIRTLGVRRPSKETKE